MTNTNPAEHGNAVPLPGHRASTLVAGEVRLSEIIGALSHALDLTEGQPPGHCMRCCWIGFHIGEALGLREAALWELYYTLLLKDAGCSSNAERLCELYATDDLRTKRDFTRVDTDSMRQLARFVFTHAAPGAGIGRRLEHILNLVRHGHSLADELVLTRCERGAAIARQLGFPESVAAAIRSLDEHWNGGGRPDRLGGNGIPLGARIALVAQVADVFFQAGGCAAAVEEIERRSGSWFDPEVADAFLAMARKPEFWVPLAAPDFPARLWELEPGKQVVPVTEQRLDAIALAFAQIVDAKSHYTYGHSERVGFYADAIAGVLGLAGTHRAWVRRGALLHDLGKLGVSNSVLDKPGRLDAREWAQVRRHPGLTEQILARIPPFAELARIAGAHHERLDGHGYPRALGAEAIPFETRIITTADVFDALTAKRPYRPALPMNRALALMEEERGTGIDPVCLDALHRTLPALEMT